jgi:hypothetical protein
MDADRKIRFFPQHGRPFPSDPIDSGQERLVPDKLLFELRKDGFHPLDLEGHSPEIIQDKARQTEGTGESQNMGAKAHTLDLP